jgi:hypothetical protein
LHRPTGIAKSNHEFYGNGYRADVEMMPDHARTATNRTYRPFQTRAYRRDDRRLGDV